MQGEIEESFLGRPHVVGIAWLTTLGASLLTHRVASAGFPLGDVRMQSALLVSIFVSCFAMLATARAMAILRQSPRRVTYICTVTAFLFACAATITYGLEAYLG